MVAVEATMILATTVDSRLQVMDPWKEVAVSVAEVQAVPMVVNATLKYMQLASIFQPELEYKQLYSICR